MAMPILKYEKQDHKNIKLEPMLRAMIAFLNDFSKTTTKNKQVRFFNPEDASLKNIANYKKSCEQFCLRLVYDYMNVPKLTEYYKKCLNMLKKDQKYIPIISANLAKADGTENLIVNINVVILQNFSRAYMPFTELKKIEKSQINDEDYKKAFELKLKEFINFFNGNGEMKTFYITQTEDLLNRVLNNNKRRNQYYITELLKVCDGIMDEYNRSTCLTELCSDFKNFYEKQEKKYKSDFELLKSVNSYLEELKGYFIEGNVVYNQVNSVYNFIGNPSGIRAAGDVTRFDYDAYKRSINLIIDAIGDIKTRKNDTGTIDMEKGMILTGDGKRFFEQEKIIETLKSFIGPKYKKMFDKWNKKSALSRLKSAVKRSVKPKTALNKLKTKFKTPYDRNKGDKSVKPATASNTTKATLSKLKSKVANLYRRNKKVTSSKKDQGEGKQ